MVNAFLVFLPVKRVSDHSLMSVIVVKRDMYTSITNVKLNAMKEHTTFKEVVYRVILFVRIV